MHRAKRFRQVSSNFCSLSFCSTFLSNRSEVDSTLQKLQKEKFRKWEQLSTRHKVIVREMDTATNRKSSNIDVPLNPFLYPCCPQWKCNVVAFLAVSLAVSHVAAPQAAGGTSAAPFNLEGGRSTSCTTTHQPASSTQRSKPTALNDSLNDHAVTCTLAYI